MTHVRLLLPVTLAIAAAASTMLGCAESEMRGTRGQLGTLSFAYGADVCGGCGIEREVLEGSVLEIDVYGMSPRVQYAIRSSALDIADFQAGKRCKHGDDGCVDRIAVTTKTAGDVDLELFDDWTGTVRERVTLHVRGAAVLESTVSATPSRGGAATMLVPGHGGVFEVKVQSDVAIVPIARSANGEMLLATSDAIQRAYADEDVLAPVFAETHGSTFEHARAKSPGVTSVVVRSGGASQELSFRVVE